MRPSGRLASSMPGAESTSSPVALITGASRGIGSEVSRALARAGYRLALTGRNQDRLDDLCRELEGLTTCMSVSADLRNPDAPARILAAIEEQLGSLNVLVNNAGTAPSNRLESTTDEDLEEVLDLHIRAPFRLLRAALPTLREQPDSCAVQVASTAGLMGFPFTAAYTAAKHGMVGLTRALAAEFAARPPRIYAVCPGFVDTDITHQAAADIAGRGRKTESEALDALGAMNQIGRLHTPAEVAGAVVHLIREQPQGCIYKLDSEPPGFV